MKIRLYEDGTIVKYDVPPGRSLRGGASYGCRKKHFEVTKKHKRLIRSSAIRLALTAKNKMLFCTLTFPEDIDQKNANKCFSNFVDNLKTNYKLNSYVAVKENTKRGRPHFHCIFDIPFTDFKVLNRAWCACFSDFMLGSANAFTVGKRPIVQNVHDVSKYITKYITKTELAQYETKPETRQYFISRNIISNPALIDENTLIYLLTKFDYNIHIEDHFTVYKLRSFACLPEQFTIKKRPPPIKKTVTMSNRHRLKPDFSQNVSINF